MNVQKELSAVDKFYIWLEEDKFEKMSQYLSSGKKGLTITFGTKP